MVTKSNSVQFIFICLIHNHIKRLKELHRHKNKQTNIRNEVTYILKKKFKQTSKTIKNTQTSHVRKNKLHINYNSVQFKRNMSIFSLYDIVMVTYPLALFGMDLTCKLKTAKTNKTTTTFICVFANGFFITFPVFLIMFGALL